MGAVKEPTTPWHFRVARSFLARWKLAAEREDRSLTAWAIRALNHAADRALEKKGTAR